MTIIQITKKNNKYMFKISGHSGYATIGNDIVCSSISTANFLLVNTLDRLNMLLKYNEVKRDDIVIVTFETYVIDNSMQAIIDTVIDYCKQLEIQYKDNVKVICL